MLYLLSVLTKPFEPVSERKRARRQTTDKLSRGKLR